MEITYRLRFTDLFWTYFGDRWTTRVVLGSSAALALLGVIKWDPSYLGWAVALLLAGPVLLPVGLMLSAGTLGSIGSEIRLVVDDQGVKGWPVASATNRSWGNLDWSRMRRSVVVLEFRLHTSRRGWAVLPLRMVKPAERDPLRRLLLRRANLDPYPADAAVGPEGTATIRRLPLDYVLSRVSLTRADVKVGLLRGALADQDVNALVERGFLDEHANAGELRREMDEALPPDWAATGDPSQYPQAAAPDLKLAEAKWLYLQLAWLWDHRYLPLDLVGLWDDFGFPAEIEDLVYFMPARPGQAVGVDALMDRWRDYLVGCEAKYGSEADARTGGDLDGHEA